MASQAKSPGSVDPVVVDSKHYQVELEQPGIRVLRAKYAPGEKSVMHSHPALIAIMLTPGRMRMHAPDGTSEVIEAAAGQVMNMPALDHLPENIGTEPFEVILVELKS
jgi:quercetin dioxygenase-like cupin family protein